MRQNEYKIQETSIRDATESREQNASKFAKLPLLAFVHNKFRYSKQNNFALHSYFFFFFFF